MNTEQINRFNVRVYFILMREEDNHILVSDEIIKGKAYTKFPGGGLEFGEGPEQCILREALEELGQEVEITGHFYTTGFFIQSAFRATDQVLPIYYTAKLKDEQRFRTTAIKHDFLQSENNEESFRWMSPESISKTEFYFPADQHVAGLLIEKYQE
jgi:8-oxo-dGTP diphosphatase